MRLHKDGKGYFLRVRYMFFDSVELMYDYIEDPNYMDGSR